MKKRGELNILPISTADTEDTQAGSSGVEFIYDSANGVIDGGRKTGQAFELDAVRRRKRLDDLSGDY